jgi:hypothetical protein
MISIIIITNPYIYIISQDKINVNNKISKAYYENKEDNKNE